MTTCLAGHPVHYGCGCDDAAEYIPHYPTSAELAAFRREIAYNRDGQAHATSLAFGCVTGASHDYERSDGIGYSAQQVKRAYRDAHDASRARKGARLIRSGMAVAFCGNRP